MSRQPREGGLERDGVRLAYLQWEGGTTTTPILLLHGLSSNAAYWQRLANHLPGRRLVALDQRCHGRSDRPESGYSLADVVADAETVLTELGWSRTVVVGHSWGATIALELVATRPDLASALAFLDGPVGPMSERLTWEEASRLMEPPLPRYGNVDEAAADVRGYLKEAWADDLLDFVRRGVVEEDGGLVPSLTHDARHQILRSLYDARPDLRWQSLELRAFVAFAGGDLGPFLETKRGWADRLRGYKADSVISWFPTPHDIPLFQPAQVATAIEDLASGMDT